MGRAGTKVGLSDPVVPDGRAIAQQIKGTPGITGLSPLSVHSGEEVWHLNTLGCCKSDLAPTNRLITVNPSVRNACSVPHPAIPWEVSQRHNTSLEESALEDVCVLMKCDDPVTTDPKGEASDLFRGNTPTLAIPTEAMQVLC